MKEKRNKYRAISLGKCTSISLSHSRTAVLRARAGRTITDCRSKTAILDCDTHTPYGIIFTQNKMEFMGRRKKADGGSRHGKHAPDAFKVAIYLSAEEKAVAILTAERQGKTLSDVLRSGIVCEATRSGVLVNGVVAEKFRARISAYRQVLEAEAKTKRSTEK